MQETTSENKRIAKNAILLYGRMFISMVISFFTSRIVLQALGVSDFGVYNLVGGIVVMIGMINGALNNATSRFLTFGLGLKDIERLKTTFSTALITHIAIALIFLILAETIGLWFVNNHLVIPTNRMGPANWAYQSAILCTTISIIQVPYNASVTSHEHFGIFAAIDITNSILKLGIALTVLYSTCDHLIEYSLLYAAISGSIFTIYFIYCFNKFPECKITANFSKKLFKEMISFTGWNLMGNTSITIYQQGTNIVLNRTFGTLINAATGIAIQVQAILYSFIGNITSAFTPQIVKSYAQKDFTRVNELIFMGAKISSLLTMLVSIPVIVKMDYLMDIWLKDVPEGTVIICQLLIVNNIFNSLNPVPYSGITANGKLKTVNILLGSTYLIMLALTYFVLQLTNSYIWVYGLSIASPIITGQYYYALLKQYMPDFKWAKFNLQICIPTGIICSIAYLVCFYCNSLINSQILSCIITFIMSSLIIIGLSLLVLIDKKSRHYILKKFK